VSILSIPVTSSSQCQEGGCEQDRRRTRRRPEPARGRRPGGLGIPINHYVELNFDTFANVVNALGGVKMYFPEPVYDAYSGLNVQTLVASRSTASRHCSRACPHLQYKAPGDRDQSRRLAQETQSDLARIRRDHEFLRVLATPSRKRPGRPLTDQQIVSSVVSQLTVDRASRLRTW